MGDSVSMCRYGDGNEAWGGNGGLHLIKGGGGVITVPCDLHESEISVFRT